MQHTIVEVAREACEKYADLTAYTCMGQDLSYSELDHLSTAFAAWLSESSGLKPGDRVSVQLPNLLQFPVATIGILKAGMVLVNVNPLYTIPELKHQLNDSGSKCLIVLANTAANAAKIVGQTSVEIVIVTEVADLHSPFKRHVTNFVVKYLKKLVPKVQFPRQLSLRQVLALGSALQVPDVSIQPENLAVLQYTGGTTGVAKGAMLSHRNLIAIISQLHERLGEQCPGSGATLAGPLPMYHIYAFAMTMLFGLYKGFHVVLIPNPRDLKSLVKALKPFVLEGFVGINTLYNALSKDVDFCNLDFSQLQLCSSGGMTLAEATANNWLALTGCRILDGYGLTEASPLVACGSYHDYKSGVVGKATPGTQIKIVDANKNSVTNGDIGEICVKGPQIMQGYWRQPKATLAVLDKEGWLRTGDLGCLDDEGYLSIVDRLKDLIIVSGFNVYPNEIEDYIDQHTDVLEAAAIGIRGSDGNEAIKLFVVSRNSDLTASDIIKYCREGLAAYKVPKLIEFRSSLPKSNVGKILKRELRQ